MARWHGCIALALACAWTSHRIYGCRLRTLERTRKRNHVWMLATLARDSHSVNTRHTFQISTKSLKLRGPDAPSGRVGSNDWPDAVIGAAGWRWSSSSSSSLSESCQVPQQFLVVSPKSPRLSETYPRLLCTVLTAATAGIGSLPPLDHPKSRAPQGCGSL